MKVILITGSSGLIGSEVATFFHEQSFMLHGVDKTNGRSSSALRGIPSGASSPTLIPKIS